MHKDIAVKLQNISKIYKLYDKSIDRLKESFHPFKKKYHKEFYALKNINLEIKKGQVLGIVGVNGAGKSTLLKIIAGVLTPTHGRVIINGKINAILELSSGLKPEMTGRENIKLNLQINGIQNDLENIISDIIEFADIGEHIDQPVKNYSSGMKARLGFGLATSTDPDVLIVDEVLAVGDVLFKRKCYNRIENLFKNGKTVIFVSHDAQAVVEFCSHAILLYDREIILSDTPKNVTEFYQKLVFNKDHNKILKELVKQDTNKKTTKTLQCDPINTQKEKDPNDFFESFKSSPNSINEELASFKNIMLYTNNNRMVNQLSLHSQYTAKYQVVFHKEMKNVSVGIRIKTLKGILVSGINLKSYKNETIPFVSKGSIYEISSSFDCLLLPGTYSLTLSCSDESGNKAALHDAFLFKVKKTSNYQGGYVTLNQTMNIYQIENKRSNH